MEHYEYYEYYEVLAERISFSGITAEAILQIAKYREGKTFRDVTTAVKQGGLEGLGRTEAEFGCMASRLHEVLEIDASAPIYDFEKRLRALPEPAQA